jgi:hypothetical protein
MLNVSILSVVMLSVFMLSVFMLSVFMLTVVMLNVRVPLQVCVYIPFKQMFGLQFCGVKHNVGKRELLYA